MAGDGGQLRGRVLTLDKILRRGLYAVIDGPNRQANLPYDGGQFDLTTGNNGLPDLLPTVPGTYVLLPASDVPQGVFLDVTTLRYYLLPGTAWTGGTAGTTSVSIQGTDGTVILTIQQQALAVATGAVGSGTITSGSVAPGSTLPTGVVDLGVRSVGASLPVGVGIVAVVSNSTAGSALRLSVQGRFVTTAPGL